MRKLKLMSLGILIGIMTLSGCTSNSSKESVKEDTKEIVIKDTVKALKGVKNYESDVTLYEELELESSTPSDALTVKKTLNGISKIDEENEKAVFDLENKVRSGSSVSSEQKAFIDFKEGEMEQLSDGEEYTGDAEFATPDETLSTLLEKLIDDEEITLTTKRNTYVLDGTISGDKLDGLLGFNYLIAAQYSSSENNFKKANVDFELEIDKKTKLPIALNVDVKDFLMVVYEEIDDFGVLKGELEISYTEYNKINTDEVVSILDNSDSSKKDTDEKNTKDEETEKDSKPEAEKEKNDEVKEPTSKDKKDEWDNFSVIANGTTYELPVEMKVFKELGFKDRIDKGNLSGKYYRYVYMDNMETGESICVQIFNPSNDPKPIDECIVFELTVSYQKNAKKTTFELPEGVKLGISEAELNKSYKEYTSLSYSKPIALYQYGKIGKSVRVHVRRDSDKVYKFTVTNDTTLSYE